MDLPEDFVQRLDLAKAIAETIPARGEFFPSRLEAFAAEKIHDELVPHLAANLRYGRALGPAEVVYVPRKTVGTRPAFDTRFADRALLAALVIELKKQVAPLTAALALSMVQPEQRETAYQDFKGAPLKHNDLSEVLIVDVAAFYEYVDHQLVADEIVALTGDIDLASGLRSALGELVERDFGIPQGPRASDTVADFYLSHVDRALMRAGIPVYRHNDEYRIPIPKSGSALRTLAQVEMELRRVGLVINPAKTRSMTKRAYVKGANALEERLASAREAAKEWGYELGLGPYEGFDPGAYEDADWTDLPVEQVEEEFATAIDATSRGFDSVSDEVISRLLPLLGGAQSAAGLSSVGFFARTRPWMMRQVSLYLRLLMRGELEGAAVNAIRPVLRSKKFVFPWARGWLVDALAHCDETLPASLIDEMHACISDATLPWFVRSRALLVLGTEHKLPAQDEVALMYAEAAPASRADVVAAVSIGEPPWAQSFAASLDDDVVLRAVAALLAESDDVRDVI